MYSNLMNKYGITEQQLKEGIDVVSKNLGLICNSKVMLAVTELLAEGDIKPQTKPILVRDITERLVECHIMVWKRGNPDTDEDDIPLADGYGFIENEEILNLEVKSIAIDGNSLNIQVY